MTVCRYFLQGNCRYGERCRFEHTENYNRNYRNQQERYSRQEEYNNYRNYNQYRYQNYESENRYNVNQRNYSPDRYSDNYRYDTPQRYSGSYGNEYSRYNQDYEQYPRYNEPNRGRSQQHSSNYQYENTSGQNRFQWQSDKYAQQRQPKEHKKTYTNETYNTSTPKENVRFSFKVPESEIKKESTFSHYKVDEQDQLHADVVKEDAKAWQLGGLWPFSCYFPCPDKHGFPGFSDISPEELRYAAYKAEENKSYETYVKSVQNALLQMNQLRSEMQIPTPQLLATLRKIWSGENLCSTLNTIASIPFIQSEEMATDIMDAASITAPSNTAASFSFKMATEPDSSSKTSAAAFSFKVSPVSESKLTVSASGGDPDIYTPLENLTEEEKEQFSASTFVLGKIPTRPPPRELCV